MAGKRHKSFCTAQRYEWSTDLSSPNQMSPIFCYLNSEMRLLLTIGSEKRYSLALRTENDSGVSFKYKVFLEFDYRKSQDIILTEEGVANLKKSVQNDILLLHFHERNIKRKLIEFSPRMIFTFVFMVYEELNTKMGKLPPCSYLFYSKKEKKTSIKVMMS